MNILIGNTFPFVLIRRKVSIQPVELDTLKEKLKSSAEIYSYWGHKNTLQSASELLKFDITPKSERPVLLLNKEFLPTLNGNVFSECWILSPDYTRVLRPSIGTEVTEEEIAGWNVLKISWEKENND